MLAPPTRTTSGVTLRPISLGSLENLRQLNNSLASAEANMGEIDTRTLTEFLWVHGAPIDEVLDTVYNYPTQIGLKATAFSMSISPAEEESIKKEQKNIEHGGEISYHAQCYVFEVPEDYRRGRG